MPTKTRSKSSKVFKSPYSWGAPYTSTSNGLHGYLGSLKLTTQDLSAIKKQGATKWLKNKGIKNILQVTIYNSHSESPFLTFIQKPRKPRAKAASATKRSVRSTKKRRRAS